MNHLQAKCHVNRALYSYRDSLNGATPDLKIVSKITNKLIKELRQQGFIIYTDRGVPIDRVTFTQVDNQVHITQHAFTEEYTSFDDSEDDFD